MPSSFCPTCDEYMYSFKLHTCAPKWSVWVEGEEEGLDLDCSHEVYATTAKDAATVFADKMAIDGEVQEWVLYVRKADDERPQAERYKLDYYMQPIFEAHRSKKQPLL